MARYLPKGKDIWTKDIGPLLTRYELALMNAQMLETLVAHDMISDKEKVKDEWGKVHKLRRDLVELICYHVNIDSPFEEL